MAAQRWRSFSGIGSFLSVTLLNHWWLNTSRCIRMVWQYQWTLFFWSHQLNGSTPRTIEVAKRNQCLKWTFYKSFFVNFEADMVQPPTSIMARICGELSCLQLDTRQREVQFCGYCRVTWLSRHPSGPIAMYLNVTIIQSKNYQAVQKKKFRKVIPCDKITVTYHEANTNNYIWG